jgi:hypothetical protein
LNALRVGLKPPGLSFTELWVTSADAKVSEAREYPAEIIELYMIPFQDNLRDAVTDAELTHIVEAMVNRGIRVRCDPEGFATALEAVDNLPSDEELEDDELKFLRDRQANKPY